MTFKEKPTTRLSAFALAAVFALTLAGCGGGGGGSATTPPDTTPMPDPAIAERMAISGAIDAAEDAVAMVNDTSGDATVTAANAAIMAAKAAIAGATSLPAAEKAAHGGTVSALEATLNAAVTSRTAYMTKVADEARTAMMETARKLHSGIGAPVGSPTSPQANTRAAAYDAAETAILVGSGGTGTAFTLSADDDTMVAANHGWAGKRYADPAGGDMVEAYVYSNVEAPTPGKKFGSAAAVTATGDFEYQLANGALTISTDGAATPPSRVAGSSFDQSAGVKTFKRVTVKCCVWLS